MEKETEEKKGKRVWSFQKKEKKAKSKKSKKSGGKTTETSTNYNPKSRENLAQYARPRRAKEREKIKKEIVKDVGLEISEEMLEVIIPAKKIFSDEEQKRFLLLFKLRAKELSDHDAKLTTSDVIAIAKLCKNSILEDRLLAASPTDGDGIASVMASINTLNKDTEKLTEKLATDRRQRVDPRAGKDVTVNDVLFMVEEEKAAGRNKLKEMAEEENLVRGYVKSSVEDMIT
jgi:hypothetical protein